MTYDPDKFTCEACKRTFTKGRSDEVAIAEAIELGHLVPDDEAVILCDDCFDALMGQAN